MHLETPTYTLLAGVIPIHCCCHCMPCDWRYPGSEPSMFSFYARHKACTAVGGRFFHVEIDWPRSAGGGAGQGPRWWTCVWRFTCTYSDLLHRCLTGVRRQGTGKFDTHRAERRAREFHGCGSLAEVAEQRPAITTPASRTLWPPSLWSRDQRLTPRQVRGRGRAGCPGVGPEDPGASFRARGPRPAPVRGGAGAAGEESESVLTPSVWKERRRSLFGESYRC